MVQTNYRNKMNSILVPEAIGALVCLLGVVFILTGLKKLDNWYLLGCGIVSALVLVILPIVSLTTIRKMRMAENKIPLPSLYKLSLCLGAILMLTVLPVMGKLIGGADLFKMASLWYWYAIGFPFFYFYTRRVFKCYGRTAGTASPALDPTDL